MWRVSARRAASIWRAVTRSGSIALRPYWPKASVAPEVATPWMRPLCALRNFMRIGCNMAIRLSQLKSQTLGRVAPRAPGIALGKLLVLRHRVVFENLALEDPHLDAAGAVGGEGGGDAVVDVGSQRMQRHAALAIPLHARDLGAAETTRAVDADALGAEPHGRLHGALHGATEGDAALELLGNVLGDQRGVDLGLADLDDVQRHLALGHLGEVGAQLLDVGALLADHHARTGGVDGDAGALGRTLDDDLGHARLGQPLAQHLADVDVFVEHRRVFAALGVPAGFPRAVDTETQADRINLLTHLL